LQVGASDGWARPFARARRVGQSRRGVDMTARPLVLVIEDERAMRQFIRVSLESHDYRTVETTNGRDGLALAASHNPDVVLLDLGLPDIDGLEVTRRMRGWSKAPIIVLSARGQE